MTTQTLLEELHTLGVQISTDGITLCIDAPKGVMTPALWNQLAGRKQELITLLGSAESGLDLDRKAHRGESNRQQSEPKEAGVMDEEEALYHFAAMISHMVDVLGGPGTVRITRHDPHLSLEKFTRQIRPPYQPVTLPAF